MITIYDKKLADGGYYINMDHREDRRNEVEQQFKRFDIKGVERMPGVVKDQYAGCGEAHKNIIKQAVKNNWKSVIMFEDDFYIMDPPSTGIGDYQLSFKECILEVLEQLEQLDWDALYFGTILHSPLKKITKNIGKVNSAKSAHALIVKESMYNDILNWTYEKYDQLDHYYYTTLQKTHKFLSSYPILINHGSPTENMSDLLNKPVTYHYYMTSTYAEYAKEFHN
jgi:GR25 family glycosyltransferase involved in LPS biosynthesis